MAKPMDSAADIDVDARQPREFLGSSRMLAVLAGGLLTVAFALVMLSATSAHAGIIFGPDEATRLLAIEMLAASLLLALVSAGKRLRLTLQMILIYLVIYLILPGYSHSSMNHYPFFNLSYAHDIRLQAAAIISVFMAALVVGYILGDQSGPLKPKGKTIQRDVIFPNVVLLVVFTAVSYVTAAAYLGFVGLETAFSTRAEFGAHGSVLQYGLTVTLPRAVTFVAFAYCYILFIKARRVGIAVYYMALNFIPFITANYPLVLARFALFGIILFFIVQTFDFRSSKSRIILTLGFILGALFAMPYVDSVTRNFERTTIASFDVAYKVYLSSGDFDGLQSIQNAVIYTDANGHTAGRQLLSAALFFVPRSVWSGKGEATGELTSRIAGYTFHNISQPLPSEFFVDFSWFGLSIASLIFGFMVARLDGWIDRNWDAGPRARLIAGVVVAYAIILMRGALLAIIAPVVSFAAGVAIIIMLGLVKPESLRIRRKPRGDDAIAPSPRILRHARAVARRS